MASRKTSPIRLVHVGIAVLAVVAASLAVFAVRHTGSAHAGNSGAASPLPSITADRPQVVWLGDSYAEGTGAASPTTSFVYLVAQAMGWTETDLAEGGTGYVADGPQNVTGPRHRIGYFVSQAAAAKPQVILFAAGINDRVALEDQHSVTLTKLRDTALHDWLDARRLAPSAQVVVIGPWWPNGSPTPAMQAMDSALRSAAQAHHVPYIDPIGEHWITGGFGPPPTGNAPKMIGPDHTHPTPAGHRYLAGMIVRDLHRLGITGH